MKTSIRLGAVCFQEYPGDYYGFLDLALELGLSWVELKFEPPICLRSGSLKYKEIKKKAVDLGIGLSLHTPFVGLNIASLNEGGLISASSNTSNVYLYSEKENADI